MVIKKSPKKETSAPVLDLGVAKLRINSAVLQEDPKEIETTDGRTFTVEPNLNTELEVVDDLGDGTYNGVKFFDRFRLKPEHNGEWTIRDGTKLGALALARYGRDFFQSDVVFDEADFEGFLFQAKVQPKKNISTGQITGSMVNFETIMPVPKPKMMTNQKPANSDDGSETRFVH
jgi:hypothetical protein